jgi:hypothetical protein
MSDIKDSIVQGVQDSVENISKGASDFVLKDKPPNSKAFLDRVQEKVVSRKLIVFITATVLIWYGLDPETWGMVAMMYIGGQSAIDMVKVWKWGS